MTIANSVRLPVLGQGGTAQPPLGTADVAELFRDVSYVTLKLTTGCNLRCDYCNVEADGPRTPKMSMDTFKRVADLLIENSSSDGVGLEFHGGEPLLLPDEWFTEAVTYAAEKAEAHGKRIEHPMQTNGTLLSDERLDLLHGLGIHIGMSLDGPPEINDSLRSAGQVVERAIRRTIARDKGIGIILVLSPANWDRMPEVLAYFRSLGIDDFMINVMQPQGFGTSQQGLDDEQLFRAMRDVFEYMRDTDCAVVEADMARAIRRFLFGRVSPAPKTCWEHECQAGRSYFAVDPHGGIFACGTDMSQHQLGDVFSPIDRSHVAATLRALHKKDAWYARCFDCGAHRICNQSCPTSDFNDIRYRDTQCGYTRRLFNYFGSNVDDVRRVFSVLERVAPQTLAP